LNREYLRGKRRFCLFRLPVKGNESKRYRGGRKSLFASVCRRPENLHSINGPGRLRAAGSNSDARTRSPEGGCLLIRVSDAVFLNDIEIMRRLPPFSSSTASQKARKRKIEATRYSSEPGKSGSLLSMIITNRTRRTIKSASM
jgi:hypothetical protein